MEYLISLIALGFLGLAGLIVAEFRLLNRRVKNIMSALSEAVALVKEGQANEEARVEAIITLLENNPDAADVKQAIEDLKALRATQDAERPSTPPVTP